MTTPLLIHADSTRDPDMFVATGVPVGDPYTYLELDGRRIIVASVLEADVIRRDSRATEVWQDDDFGTRELIKQGWSYRDAAMERVRRVLERAQVPAVTVPPSFPVGLADYLRAHDVSVTPDAELFALRRRIKDGDQLAAIRQAQRATEAAFTAVRELLGSSSPSPGGLVAGGAPVT
jgi:Xaa-Pro aminopeptidase